MYRRYAGPGDHPRYDRCPSAFGPRARSASLRYRENPGACSMSPWAQAGAVKGPACPAMSGGVGGAYDGEVDVCLRDLVQVVGEAILCDDGDDFDDLAVLEAGVADRFDI